MAGACGCRARSTGRAGRKLRRAPSGRTRKMEPPRRQQRQEQKKIWSWRPWRLGGSISLPSSPPLILVGPVLPLERPVLLVVADHRRVPQPADQLLGEAAGREVLNLDV